MEGTKVLLTLSKTCKVRLKTPLQLNSNKNLKATSCADQEGHIPSWTCNTKEIRRLASPDKGGHPFRLPKPRCLSPNGRSHSCCASATVVVLRYCVGQSPRGVGAGRSLTPRRPSSVADDVATQLQETKRVRAERLKALRR
ncbi:hypothetical protein RB195_001329 [Necator americanus]|uniref:Uncharacterized protein n=1 Tax=Necator americanus TaxID=51031 RepID=A0ABR1DGR6_NECAM